MNPGSIGMPYGRAGGNWALLEGGNVSLRHTPVDLDEMIAAVAAGSNYPDARAWAEDCVRSEASDVEALTTFGPRDGMRVTSPDASAG